MSTKGCLAVAVAGLAAALPATSAADFNQGTANGITYINDQTSVPAGQASAPAAECLPGSHLIGAAADSLDSGSAGILSSLRADDDDDGNATRDDGVTAFTHNTTGAGAGSHVWAFCATGKVRYPTRTTQLELGDTRAIKAKCPAGTKVLSGGFYLDGLNSQVHLNAMRPIDDSDDGAQPDDGWQVRVTNLAGADKLYQAWAFCRADIKPRYLDAASTVNAGDVDFASLSCPTQSRSVAGVGGEVRGDPDGRRISGIEPADDTSQGEPDTFPDDRAFIEVDNPTASEASFTINLICTRL